MHKKDRELQLFFRDSIEMTGQKTRTEVHIQEKEMSICDIEGVTLNKNIQMLKSILFIKY